MLSIREAAPEDHVAFDDLVAEVALPTITQTFAWRPIIEASPSFRALPLVFEDNGQAVATAMLTLKRFPLGFLGISCHGGPVLREEGSLEPWRAVLEALCEWAKKRRALFLRIQPSTPFREDLSALLGEEGFSPFDRQVPDGATRVIPLAASPEELLERMHSSARRDTRLAERKGIRYEVADDESLLDVFWEIYSRTCEAHGLTPRPKESLRHLLKAGLGSIHLGFDGDAPTHGNLLAHHPKLLATLLLCSATDRQASKVPAGHYVHWCAMKWAKERGFGLYDLGGIGLEGRDRGGLESIDTFKRRLGGYDLRFFIEHQSQRNLSLAWKCRTFFRNLARRSREATP